MLSPPGLRSGRDGRGAFDSLWGRRYNSGAIRPAFSGPRKIGVRERRPAVKKRRKFLSLLLKGITGLLTVILILLIGFLLVMAQPQQEETEKAAPQPLLTASPALEIEDETRLRTLVESFPVPVLSFMSGSGMVFVSGNSADAGLEGGFGRMVTLYWQTPDGDPLILRSIYPASALSLLEKDYHFSPIAGPSLFGSDSVRMENADTVRIHAATDTGLYSMIVPKDSAAKISSISRSLQLFSVPREEETAAP